MSRRRFRASNRSKDSSSASVEADPREKIKDCCRKFVAFMCTQVGVGALVVCYTIIGAFGFREIEKGYEDGTIHQVHEIRNRCAEHLWIVAKHNNVFNRTAFYIDISAELKVFQNDIVDIIKKGYDGRGSSDKMWTFPAALMFSLSIITMIGYGNLVPRTTWGKFATVIYAVFGIPLYVLYFLNMGEILAGCFKWIYTSLYECTTRKSEKTHKRIIVPSTACLWVIGGYILTGTIMFAEWEQWSYLDSTYFCVTSLCKLGLGDLVPGTASKEGNESKLVINFIYILGGLGLVAMCYNLMREQVRVKVQELREDFRQCLEDTSVSIEVLPDMLDEKRSTSPLRFSLSGYKDMLDEKRSTSPLRFSLSGYEGRPNDILYSPPLCSTQNQSSVIYFGGDIQDFQENMEGHRDNKNYLNWSLENTAQILQNAFQESHVVVIRPSRMDYKTFSCFDNFVPSGNCGVPDHVPMHHSLTHVQFLLEDLRNQLTDIEMDTGDLRNSDLKLIGFSKGCVVLNQFLYEFHSVKTSNEDNDIISKVKDMYWLDGGHSGGKNTWITNRSLLETLSMLGINIHIHVSPYQIKDERRPWIRKEEKIFYNTLLGLKAPVQRHVHSPDILPSIYQHFNILNEFDKRHSTIASTV